MANYKINPNAKGQCPQYVGEKLVGYRAVPGADFEFFSREDALIFAERWKDNTHTPTVKVGTRDVRFKGGTSTIFCAENARFSGNSHYTVSSEERVERLPVYGDGLPELTWAAKLACQIIEDLA